MSKKVRVFLKNSKKYSAVKMDYLKNNATFNSTLSFRKIKEVRCFPRKMASLENFKRVFSELSIRDMKRFWLYVGTNDRRLTDSTGYGIPQQLVHDSFKG
jgi:hypothetical protein